MTLVEDLPPVPGNIVTDYVGDDLEALAGLANYQAWIIDAFRPYLAGEAVEIGAGIGSMSRLIRPHVVSLDCVEPAANLFPILSARLAGLDVHLHRLGLEAYLAAAAPASRDTLVMINLLEHVADDAAALVGAYRLLRPGGHLLLYVPAMPALFSRMDRLLGHHRRYDSADLADKVRRAGFEIVSNRYHDQLGYFAWLLVHTWLGRTRFSAGMAQLYDRIGVPLTRAWEARRRPSFAKNLLLIARR